jgi:hypothetical protein
MNRRSDVNTLRALTSVALWHRTSHGPTRRSEAEPVLRALCQQLDPSPETALDPPTAAATQVLLNPARELAQQAPGPAARPTRRAMNVR